MDVAHQSYDWKVGARLAAVTERLRKTAPCSTRQLGGMTVIDPGELSGGAPVPGGASQGPSPAAGSAVRRRVAVPP
jgi:hypothetical protein